MWILITRQPQPIRAQPNTVAGDHRLSGGQPAPPRQGFTERFGGKYRRQYGTQDASTLHLGLQRCRVGHTARTLAYRHNRQITAVESAEYFRNAVQPIDAHGLEIGSQHGFDRALPAAVDA